MGSISPLIRKLEQIGPLAAEERRLLETVPIGAPKHYRPGQVLVHEGDHPADCKLILSGYACRYRLLDDGRRQIVSFNLSGDLVDLTSLLLGRLDHGIAAVTRVTAASLPHSIFLDWMEHNPQAARILWRNTLVDAAMFREWVVNLGGRSAYQRIAHLLCELVTRMRRAGLLPVHAGAGPVELPPIRQGDLGDATGLSMVHVNRTLQQMRREGLVRPCGRTIVVTDWEGLTQASGFDPAYLHQTAPTPR